MGNPKVERMMNQIYSKKEHPILLWVPGHASIQENKKTDQQAKTALQGESNKNYITVAQDWKNWIKQKQEEIRQAEWTAFDNPMVTVKPRIKKNNGEQAFTRRDQVIISRLRMGYTRLTHGYRVDLNLSPECGDCGVRLTVDHLLWDYPTLRRQRIECNISKEKLSGDEGKIRRMICPEDREYISYDMR
jgi:hypothetical protein